MVAAVAARLTWTAFHRTLRDMTLMHATCVAIDGVGVLIRGASGAGKSDLALRLIDGGAALVGDDYCDVTAREGLLIAQAATGSPRCRRCPVPGSPWWSIWHPPRKFRACPT